MCSTNNPPTIGPAAVATAEALTQVPTARLSSPSPGKAARSSASGLGSSRAPKTPWTPRRTITASVVPARPMASDATEKPDTATRNTRRRPKWSPSLPPRISETASASRYALVIHCRSASEACRSRPMYGLATATTDPSIATMTTAMDTTTRVIQGRLRSWPGATAVATASVTQFPSSAGPRADRRLTADGLEPVQDGRVDREVHRGRHVDPAVDRGGAERGHGARHVVGVHLPHREVTMGWRGADPGNVRDPVPVDRRDGRDRGPDLGNGRAVVPGVELA